MSDFLDYEQLKYYDLNIKDVLKVWQKNYPYSKGDIVQYRGKYIECTKNGTSDKTVPLDIGNVSIGDTVADHDIIWKVIDIRNVIVEWKPNKTYYTDNICIYRGKLYRAKSRFTSGAQFLPSQWELISNDIRPWFPYKDSSIVALFDFEPSHYTSDATNGLAHNFASLDDSINFLMYNASSSATFSVQASGYNGKYAVATGNNSGGWGSTATLATNDLASYRQTEDLSVDFFARATDASIAGEVKFFTASVTLNSTNWSYICMVYDHVTDTVDVWKDSTYTGTIATQDATFSFSPGVSVDDIRIRRGKLFDKSVTVEIPKDDYANSFAYRNTPFYINDFCEYKGALYKCIEDDLTDTSFDTNKWQKLSSSSSDSGSSIKEWKAVTEYEENIVVLKDNCLYRCIEAHTSSGDFANDIAKWKICSSNPVDWAKKTYYPLGIVVIKDNGLYVCMEAHTSTDLFDTSKFAVVDTSALVRDWATNTYYKEHEIVLHEGVLYRAEASHIAGADFQQDLTTNAYWLEISLGENSSSSNSFNSYKQLEAIDVVAPKQYNVTIPYTDTFLLPPVEALKFKSEKGTWTKAIYGDEYTYEYSNKSLQVDILKDGTYKVNYPLIGKVDDKPDPDDKDVPMYGVTFDGTNSLGVRTYDATTLNFTPSTATVAGTDDFKDLAPFNVKECCRVYSSSGTQYYYKENYSDSEWQRIREGNHSTIKGDIMIEIPSFYYSRPSENEFIVAPRAKHGFLPSPAHFRNGKLLDKIWVTKYNINTNYESKSKTSPRIKTNLNTFRSNLRNKEMYVLDYPTWCSLVILALVKYANMNVQASVANGYSSGSSAYANGDADNVLGLDGSNTSVNTNEASLCMGIENLYGNVWKFIDGAYSNNLDFYLGDILNITTDPTVEDLATYTKLATKIASTNSSDLIKTISYDTSAPYCIYPTSKGSPCPSGDSFSSNKGFNYCAVGGAYWNFSKVGLFAFYAETMVDKVTYGSSDYGVVGCCFS